MCKSRVMIVEDDVLIASDLEAIALEAGAVEVVLCASVRDALTHLDPCMGFAFLDVDVLDGKSFSLAEHLRQTGVPFAFISGSRPQELPASLRSAPFVQKPYSDKIVRKLLEAAKPH